MIKNKLNLALLSLMIIGLTVVTSCRKKDNAPEPEPEPVVVDSDQSGLAANNTAESISSDMVSMGSEASDKSSSGSLGTYRSAGETESSLLSCANVTRDSANKIVTVTFSGNPCIDGKVRTGSLIFNYSGSTNGATHYRDPGFKVVVTSNNYAVDGNTVTINNKSITNTTPVGFNPLNTNQTWSITAAISVNMAGGGSITWNCNRVKTLLNTAVTYTNANVPINWLNARVGLTGTASGSRSNGESFSVNITNQLIRDFGACSLNGRHPFIQGTSVYTPSGKSARTFDYGQGACDLDATVTIDGVNYTFKL